MITAPYVTDVVLGSEEKSPRLRTIDGEVPSVPPGTLRVRAVSETQVSFAALPLTVALQPAEVNASALPAEAGSREGDEAAGDRHGGRGDREGRLRLNRHVVTGAVGVGADVLVTTSR